MNREMAEVLLKLDGLKDVSSEGRYPECHWLTDCNHSGNLVVMKAAGSLRWYIIICQNHVERYVGGGWQVYEVLDEKYNENNKRRC